MLCNHFRAVQFFLYSMNPRNKFIGTYCDYHGLAGTFNNLTDQCHSPISDLFGVHAKGIPGEFQLVTTGTIPFCVDCY